MEPTNRTFTRPPPRPTMRPAPASTVTETTESVSNPSTDADTTTTASVRPRPSIPRPSIPRPAVPTTPTKTAVPVPVPTSVKLRTVAVEPPSKPVVEKTPAKTSSTKKSGLMKQFAVSTAVKPKAGKTAMPVVKSSTKSTVNEFIDMAHIWNGTEAQAKTITDLTYENNEYIIDGDDIEIFVEVISILQNDGFEYSVKFLDNAPSRAYILWDQSALDASKSALQREMDMYEDTETGVKGVGKCPSCGSNELLFSSKQTRGGDEGTTVFTRCTSCDYKSVSS